MPPIKLAIHMLLGSIRLGSSSMLAALTILASTLILAPTPAKAQVTGVTCYVTGSNYLDFGAINLFSGNIDNVMAVNYTCQALAVPSGIAYVRLCVNLGSGTGGSTLSPRLMSAVNDSSGVTLQYNFFADAARTVIIGNDNQGSYPPLNVTTQIPVSSFFATISGTINLYARVFSGQGARLSSPYAYYNSQFPGSQSQLKWAWSSNTVPASCISGSGTGSSDLNVQVQAHIQSGCFISTTTDLDFGQSSGAIASNRDQSSTITVACSGNPTWQVGLNNGTHYAHGTRNMMNADGSTIQYQLYRDPARTQLWGATVNSDTVAGSGTSSTQLIVYGRVPAQTASTPGTYSDTITVTLTY